MSERYFIKIARVGLLTSYHKDELLEKQPCFSFDDEVYFAYSQLGKEARFFASDKEYVVPVLWTGCGLLVDYDVEEPPKVRQLVEKEVFEIK
jgi:hypothetical protein